MGQSTHDILVVGLISCLGVLSYFKYRGLAASFFDTFDADDIWLPIGISFYTFQVIGYMADVYRVQIKPERHIGKYAAYVVFFPQVVAGSIERTEHLLPQIKNPPVFQYEQVTYGLKRMTLG